jgi:acyl carrier protein
VKIRGFRVEPGEIEHALLKHPLVNEAAVIAIDNGQGGDRQLVAFVSGHDGYTANKQELRRFLAATLPKYMVPSQFVTLPRLPRNRNGKINRSALRNSDVDVGESGNWTEFERLVALIWGEVLPSIPNETTANFFELGGHSISAIQSVMRLREHLTVEVGLRDLFNQPTLAGFARTLEERVSRY